jgi:hypothetical protein
MFLEEAMNSERLFHYDFAYSAKKVHFPSVSSDNWEGQKEVFILIKKTGL